MTSWLEGWKRRNWVSSTKAPVKTRISGKDSIKNVPDIKSLLNG